MISIFHGIANGLSYLDGHCKQIIMHSNVILSASSIQLEPQPANLWRAKLSDFGSTNFLKTLRAEAIVYTAPEMFLREGLNTPMPHPTTKCDVFSYGIVIVEVITRTKPTRENRHQLFCEVKTNWPFIYKLACRCTNTLPEARPTLSDILNIFKNAPSPSHSESFEEPSD